MGLDMYLSRKVHIANYNHDPDGQKMAKAIFKALSIKNVDDYKEGSLEVSLPAMYWRKANAIHGWFVANVQNNVDDCGHYDVSMETLTELRDLCADVLAGKQDKALLPPTEGFFFGNTDNEEYYKEDLTQTVEGLTRVLDAPKISKYDYFEYHSSW